MRVDREQVSGRGRRRRCRPQGRALAECWTGHTVPSSDPHQSPAQPSMRNRWLDIDEEARNGRHPAPTRDRCADRRGVRHAATRAGRSVHAACAGDAVEDDRVLDARQVARGVAQDVGIGVAAVEIANRVHELVQNDEHPLLFRRELVYLVVRMRPGFDLARCPGVVERFEQANGACRSLPETGTTVRVLSLSGDLGAWRRAIRVHIPVVDDSACSGVEVVEDRSAYSPWVVRPMKSRHPGMASAERAPSMAVRLSRVRGCGVSGGLVGCGVVVDGGLSVLGGHGEGPP
jgi:hypothetical protein